MVPAVRTFTRTIEGRDLEIGTGLLAQNADASCTIRFGDMVLLATVCDGEPRPGDLYAKVASGEPGPDGGMLVRFTSADPEVMDVLRQALAGSASTSSSPPS